MSAFTLVLPAAALASLAHVVVEERQLASRATSLRREISSLEEERQALLVILPDAPRGERLRTALSGRTARGATSSAKFALR